MPDWMNLQMKSSILICAYLAKDILVSWWSTPTALFARFFLCVFLCFLYLAMNAFFVLAESKIQEKIDSFGLGTILLKAFDNQTDSVEPSLSELFAPLGDEGLFLPFEHTFILGELTNGKKCRIIAYEEVGIAGLLGLSEEFSKVRSPYFLISGGFPQGHLEYIKIHDLLLEAEVFQPPKILNLLAQDQPILFVSKEFVDGLGTFKMNQGILFISDSTNRMEIILSSIRATMENTSFERFELSSPMDWVGEIENLRNYRLRAQTFSGILIGSLILFTFGSISIFEFRKNLFVISLFKSFGIKSSFLYLRYFFDGLVVSFLSCWLASWLGIKYYSYLFEQAQLSFVGFEELIAATFPLKSNSPLLFILLFSVLVSSVPISFALRKPVGKTLG